MAGKKKDVTEKKVSTDQEVVIRICVESPQAALSVARDGRTGPTFPGTGPTFPDGGDTIDPIRCFQAERAFAEAFAKLIHAGGSRHRDELYEELARAAEILAACSGGSPDVAFNIFGDAWRSVKSAVGDAIESVGNFVGDNQADICAADGALVGGIVAGLAVLRGTDPATALLAGKAAADQVNKTCMGG